MKSVLTIIFVVMAVAVVVFLGKIAIGIVAPKTVEIDNCEYLIGADGCAEHKANCKNVYHQYYLRAPEPLRPLQPASFPKPQTPRKR